MANEKTVHTPTVYGSGVTPFMTRWALSFDEVRALLEDLNDNSITSLFSQLYSDHIDNIVSLYFFPFDVIEKLFPIDTSTAVKSQIEVSTASLPTRAYRIDDQTPNQVAALLSLGQIGVSRYYNNFLDFAPYTKVELYLPFIGFETLDTDLVMGKTIKIRYAIDTYTGKCTAYVILAEENNDVVIMTRDGQCGAPIQVCGGSGAELARNMLRAGVNMFSGMVSTGTALAAGHPFAAAATLGAATVGTMDAARINVHKGTQQTALTSGYGPLMAYLIYTRPVVAEPSSYAHSYGRPCGKTLTLSACSGFTQVDAVHVEGSGFATATIGERDEIERLLKTGVLL